MQFNLENIKKQKDLLLAELKQTSDGKHLHCPFHDDALGSLWIMQADSGDWLWKCEGCGIPERPGTLVDAMMFARNLSSPKAAIRALAEDLGQPIREPAPPPPQINQDRAEAIVQKAHANLMGNFDLQERMLYGRRSITNLDIVKQLRLGFLENQAFQGWHSWRLTCWVLPITDAEGKLRAVKLHNEFRSRPDIPKCLWAPVAIDGKHSYNTLWPPPEMFNAPPVVVVCPGELKALALISVGLAATSPTFAEGKPIPESLLNRIKSKKLAFCFDGEPDKRKPDGTVFNPGLQWRDKCFPVAAAAGFEVVSFTYAKARPVDQLPAQESNIHDLEAEWTTPIEKPVEDPTEVAELRNRLGGGPDQWLAKGLSLNELRQLESFEQATKRTFARGATLNEREFYGCYVEPKRITRRTSDVSG